MRFVWLCALMMYMYGGAQKAQIIQTYTYQAEYTDFKQRLRDGGVEIQIQSKPLLDFLNSNELEGRMERQVVRFNDAYTEFKASHQMIHTYSNSSTSKLKFNFTQMIYELEYIGDATYRVKNAIELIDDVTKCRFLIQKTMTSLIDSRKDFVINLDNQYYLGKVLATYRYLRCSTK
ncbi:hypothetical protein [Helicobacter pametensis]|uniref:hypothetical protein n=1 Tax=Helicobacter pametensis TaxID=95149 RepID=UPI00048853D3|nr:hypothetical protein [Helicobacter pametensis]